MKKMMTNMKTLAALLMAGAAVTSCSSDNEMDSPKAPAVKTYTMTVQATKGGDAMTRALADGGDGTLTATWATTENVYVKKDDTWATGSLKPQTAGASTTLKGELSGVTIAPNDELTLQFPKSGDITYAGQKGTLADIAANFDYAVAKNVYVASVDGDGNITTDENNIIQFDHQQAIVRFTLVDKANTSTKLSPTALTINDGTSDIVTLTGIPDATYTTNGAGVLFVAIPGFSDKTITLTATVGSDTYTCTTSSAKSFDNGSYYRVTAKMTKQATVPDGAISGVFSVSATKQVYFSKGNLRATYNGSSWTWSFATNQYDYIGNDTGNTKVTSSSPFISKNATVDLFGWSTAATTYGIHNSDDNSTYSGEFVDWGATMGSGWRTLTGGDDGEWEYLFGTNPSNKRTTTSGILYAKATVNDVSGVILLPDDWSTSYYTLNSTNSTDAAFNTNTISESDWSSKLESHGCVFLPAAGYREGTMVREDGSFGDYWSSTASSSDKAYDVYFDSDNVGPAYNYDRYYGFSVRLVHDAN